MIDWKLVNKLRPHNRKETMKHFIVKAMVFKLFFNQGDHIYSEYDCFRNKKHKVADIVIKDKNNVNVIKAVIEVETKPTKKHNRELLNFWTDENLYIIDVREIPNDLKKMQDFLEHVLGL